MIRQLTCAIVKSMALYMEMMVSSLLKYVRLLNSLEPAPEIESPLWWPSCL